MGQFLPYMDLNPRRTVQLLNTYNIARQLSPVSGLIQGTLMRMIVLLDHWPVRMSFLMVRASIMKDSLGPPLLIDDFKAQEAVFIAALQQPDQQLGFALGSKPTPPSTVAP